MQLRVRIDGQTYTVEIENLQSRPVQVRVDGEQIEVWPEASPAAAAPPAAPAVADTPSNKRPAPSLPGTVPAPLPGDIVQVAVKAGDLVAAGQLLCTIESMKMNNPIRSPYAGTVESVHVVAGEHVHHGQPLLQLRRLQTSPPATGS
ncbi:MAG: biotin/lipoyl-binding protein [Caldilinea sp.]|jgi:biotin carboxyl carrier protein|nr:biotin/lipoyl-binding protein [Caldilinea sp.]